MTLHNFERSQGKEAKWAPLLDAALRDFGYDVRPATSEEQWRGIDRIVTDGGEPMCVEFKCDERAQHTQNLFFELLSNTTTGRPGCVLTTESDWFLYFAVPHRCFVFWTLTLRELVAGWREIYPVREADNFRQTADGAFQLYSTRGVIVPIAVAEPVAESVSWLSRGDAIVLQRNDGEVRPHE